MGVVVKQKKVVAVAVLVFIASCLPATSFAGPKQGSLSCKPTSAAAHQPLNVKPPASLKHSEVKFTLNTNCGPIVFTADGVNAPVTVTVMSTLAKAGYFDNSLCHRLTTSGIWVLQCGDPTASGSGGPAFNYVDENLPTGIVQNDYPAGTVAMANSGPHTNGSQFFLVYQNTTLPPNYTIWGHITRGLNIVQGIAALGTTNGSGDGSPKQPIAIQSVSVK